MGDVTELCPGDRDSDQGQLVSSFPRNRLPLVGSGKGVEIQLNQ